LRGGVGRDVPEISLNYAPDPDKGHRAPRGAGVLGMWLFLAALTMLFLASLVGYVVIRMRRGGIGTVTLPWGLWVSTALMLSGSVSIHLALRAVRRERQVRFRQMMVASLALACSFVAVQAPSMAVLLARHRPGTAMAGAPVSAYGLIFFLILVHALHVIGGIVPLAVVTGKALKHRYDHESHEPVRYLGMYWHFLDGVWVVMFGTLLVTR
jgi:cytochrome c oxidase subunit 3